MGKKDNHRVTEAQRADLRGKKCGLLRVVTRKFTKVRTDQGRGYAIVRIFTGETNFLIRKAGN